MRGRVSSSLKRRQYRREPKRRFVVFCEGRNTEPAYLAALEKIFCGSLIEIERIPAAGVPYTIAESAVKRAKALGLARKSRKQLNSFEERDEVWAVFDRDEHPRFAEAVALCSQVGVGMARSNPCFEVWLILHEQDYDKPDGRKAVQKHYSSLRPEYDPNEKIPDCLELIKRIDVAEERAKKQLERREREGASYGPPSTTFGQLTLAIRAAAKLANRK